jgi:segregation and condensation protein B
MSRFGDARGPAAENAPADPAWSCEEIERLYRQALDAVEAVANDLNSVTQTLSTDVDREADDEDNDEGPVASLPFGDVGNQPANAEQPSTAQTESRPNPVQVIEALLFVGGHPLTTKAICGVLRDDFDIGFVQQAIEEIGRRYARQNRPYEIRLSEGGYRIALRSEYEPLRNRVYGFGPKQVRLSQETLEILALVAYRQPISRRMTEEIARRNAGSALRQLSERGLVVLDPPQATSPEEPQYRTTARFLQLFGVARLDELPQMEDLNYK